MCVCREHHNFLKLCLRLLSNHLALALAGGVATSILGRQAGPLRNLLFRLMDSSVPDEIQEVRRRLGRVVSYLLTVCRLHSQSSFLCNVELRLRLSLPACDYQAVIETLSVGATMLLPPLRERMELLHSLLPQGPDRWESLSKGQVTSQSLCLHSRFLFC